MKPYSSYYQQVKQSAHKVLEKLISMVVAFQILDKTYRGLVK